MSSVKRKRIQQRLYSFTQRIFRSRVRHEIVFMQRTPYPQERPLIFAVNHSCMYDVPMANTVIGEQTCLFCSNEIEHSLEGVFLRMTGAVFVDRTSSESGRHAMQKLKERLLAGSNALIFPEGTWNLWPSTPMLPMKWGITELAKQTGVPVVPVILEYRENRCYVSIGEALHFAPDLEKKVAITELRDVMSSLRWEIWEQFPREKRADIPADWFEKLAAHISGEYPHANPEREKSMVFRDYVCAEEVFAPVEALEAETSNAFLLAETVWARM